MAVPSSSLGKGRCRHHYHHHHHHNLFHFLGPSYLLSSVYMHFTSVISVILCNPILQEILFYQKKTLAIIIIK